MKKTLDTDMDEVKHSPEPPSEMCWEDERRDAPNGAGGLECRGASPWLQTSTSPLQ